MRGVPNRRTHRCRGAVLGTGLTCSRKGEKAGRGQGTRSRGAQDGMRPQKQAEVRHMGHGVQSRCGGEVAWGSDSSPAHVSAVILQLMPYHELDWVGLVDWYLSHPSVRCVRVDISILVHRTLLKRLSRQAGPFEL